MEKRPPKSIEAIFLEIVELPAADRLRALDDHCGDDAALRSRVARLLRADEANHRATSLDQPVAQWPRMQTPTSIGGYRVVGVAGEGGTGMVFEAIHESTRRRAAIKLIHSGLTTPHGRQRLAIEAETLGRLNHEGIARLYEAGLADINWPDAAGSRSPFIAMEFIENAVSVTQFTRQKQLSPRDAVRLIAQIADAVHHAHQRGVIHRDLKPGNVLIDGSTGVAKIVDFGIARLTDADLTGITQTGQVVGTLRYMSPEQANADPKLIDARTDIYSLGAMLYELLSGRPVIDAPSGSSAAALVQLLNAEPPRLASVDAAFKGDLDAIVHKAIRRNPEDRYASAAALADDLERYLDGREVSARAPTALEQVGRLVKRHKTVTAAAAIVLLSISAGAIAATWGLVQANRARIDESRQRLIAEAQTAEAEKQRVEAETQRAEADRRREEAEAVTSFLTIDLLRNAGPANLPDKAVRDVIVQKLIDPAAALVGERFKDKPLVEAAVRHSISSTYLAIGRSDLALSQAQVALEIHRRLLGNDDPRTTASINNVGYLLRELGRIAEAEPYYREALERRRRTRGENDPETLVSMNNLASFLLAQGKLAEAEELWQTVLERRREIFGADASETLIVINNLGNLFERQGKLDQAEDARQRVLDARVRTLGEKHPDSMIALHNMASLKYRQKKLPEAETLWREALRLRREVLGDDHPDTLASLESLASLLGLTGNLDQAEAMHRESYTRRLASQGERHPATLLAMSNLANALQKLGRVDEAIPLLRVVLERRREVPGSDHEDTIVAMDALARMLIAQGQFAEALPLRQEALDRVRKGPAFDRDPKLINVFATRLASCLDALNRPEEAAAVRTEFRSHPSASTQPATQPTR